MRVKLDRIVSTRTRAAPAPEKQEQYARAEAEGGKRHGPAAPDHSY